MKDVRAIRPHSLKPVEVTAAHRRFVVAPMMELTDRHYRYLARLLSQHALLYTEMLTSGAVLNGDRAYLLGSDLVDAPCVLQLGGSDPGAMAEAASIGQDWGYSEINMNVGCPSDRVKAGRFGACLMAEPDLVASNVSAMQNAVSIPVTVKCRLGIDRDDSYEAVENFISGVADAGCQHFVVHARKAWLDGLSPKENRSVPPLRYDHVYRLKKAFPSLHITINGGIDSWESIDAHLQHVDAVMLGRKAYYDPAFLARVDTQLYPDAPEGKPDRDDVEALAEVARAYALYAKEWVDAGLRPMTLIRHVVPLFQSVPGARQWRRHLSENAARTTDVVSLVDDALQTLQQRNAA